MVTKRTANVIVKNQTGGDLLTVHVCHKYSDNYKHQKDFAGILQNGQSTNETMRVEYNTGFGTTGRDWWYVAFTMADGSFYMSNPGNCREFIDGFEKVGKGALNVIGGLCAVQTPAIGMQAYQASSAGYSMLGSAYGAYAGAVGVASAIGLVVANCMMNTESTAGFKQHILRAEDAGKNTEIIITKEQIKFESRSGTSTTGARRAHRST